MFNSDGLVCALQWLRQVRTLNSSLELPTIWSRLGPKAGVMSVAV